MTERGFPRGYYQLYSSFFLLSTMILREILPNLPAQIHSKPF
nr:MAG TPA: hypothetical protein [Caudoviricetes sp.]